MKLWKLDDCFPDGVFKLPEVEPKATLYIKNPKSTNVARHTLVTFRKHMTSESKQGHVNMALY